MTVGVSMWVTELAVMAERIQLAGFLNLKWKDDGISVRRSQVRQLK